MALRTFPHVIVADAPLQHRLCARNRLSIKQNFAETPAARHALLISSHLIEYGEVSARVKSWCELLRREDIRRKDQNDARCVCRGLGGRARFTNYTCASLEGCPVKIIRVRRILEHPDICG